MRRLAGAMFRCLTWYLALFWILTYLLGASQLAAAIITPVTIVTINSIGTRRFYRGVHRRKGTAGQAGLRGPVRRAGPGQPGCSAGHPGCACSCPRCAGPGLSLRQVLASGEIPPGCDYEDPALPGGIRLRYAPREPLDEANLDEANLTAAVNFTRNVSGKSTTMRLYSGPPPPGGTAIVSGSGYTSGSLAQFPKAPAPAQVRSMLMTPHSAGCSCPACVPAQGPPGWSCGCQWCTAFRAGNPPPPPPFAPGGIVPSPPAASAGQPPSYVPVRPRASRWARGMDGFDGAELVAGTALGFRWWTLKAPALHRNPADATREWEPGLLHGVKDFWNPGINLARCIPGSAFKHPDTEVPHDACSCGYWAYWEIQQHDMGVAQSLPVVGVVKASGQVIMGPRGFRAQKAEIVALHLPFRIEPDLPGVLVAATRPVSPRVPPHRFTGQVISFPGAPPLPPSLGGPQPAPPPPAPAPVPPSGEEIQAAKDLAEAWMAVIADRLAVTYPGAEVCATLDLMKAKYPVRSEYTPPEDRVQYILCPYCGAPGDPQEIHKHITENHRL